MTAPLEVLSEEETTTILHMALAEVRRQRAEIIRQRAEIIRQQGMRQNAHDQIHRLADENMQLAQERDQARAAVQMEATASAYHGELMLIAESLGVEGIAETRDTIQALITQRNELFIERAALFSRARAAEERTEGVIRAWKSYRTAEENPKQIGNFYNLADALDALAQAQPQEMQQPEELANRTIEEPRLLQVTSFDQFRALESIMAERERQDIKWGEQNNDPFCYLTVLIEEVGEFAQAALHTRFGGPAASGLRDEAVHTAAVALAMIECLDRAKWTWPTIPEEHAS